MYNSHQMTEHTDVLGRHPLCMLAACGFLVKFHYYFAFVFVFFVFTFFQAKHYCEWESCVFRYHLCWGPGGALAPCAKNCTTYWHVLYFCAKYRKVLQDTWSLHTVFLYFPLNPAALVCYEIPCAAHPCTTILQLYFTLLLFVCIAILSLSCIELPCIAWGCTTVHCFPLLHGCFNVNCGLRRVA